MKRYFPTLLLLALCFACRCYSQTATDTVPFRLSANNENNVALLRWENLGNGVYYDVWRRLPMQENYQLLVTTDTILYADTIARSVCHDTVSYRVLAWIGETFYQSNRMLLFFHDEEPTRRCTLKNATVDIATQRLVLSWNPSPDDDIMGYVIHKGTNGSRPGSRWLVYDTVWGKESNTYICPQLDLGEVHAFRIFAFDSCFQSSPLTPPYQNISLKAMVPECSRQLIVQWTPYINMPNSLASYELLLDIDDAGWQPAMTIAPDDTLYSKISLPGAGYKVRVLVRAISENRSDTVYSNIVDLQLSNVGVIGYLQLDDVSVSDDNSAVVLKGSVDSTFQVQGYNLYRNSGDGWQLCSRLPFRGTSSLFHEDATAYPSAISYSYRLGVPDGCGSNESYSNEMSSMLLSTTASDDRLLRLSWNTPTKGSDAMYQVLRRKESDASWQLLGNTDNTTFVDDISLLGNLHEALYYRVKLIDDDTMQSNFVRYAQKVRIYAPNAFIPSQDGNNKFCVFCSFLPPDSYEMYIYNRQGQQLFSSTDMSECWDGTIGGAPVPQGVYVWLVKYRNTEGKEATQKGTVLLLR